MNRQRIPLPEMPLVALAWDDAHGTATATVNAQSIATEHQPIRILTLGWLLRQDEQGVSVCSEYCGDGDYRGHTFVPAALVRGVRILRKGTAT